MKISDIKYSLWAERIFCPMNLSVDNRLELNVGSLEQGLYILKISIDEKIAPLKFHKEN